MEAGRPEPRATVAGEACGPVDSEEVASEVAGLEAVASMVAAVADAREVVTTKCAGGRDLSYVATH